MWDSYRRGFKAYLQVDWSLTDASIEAYLQDLEKIILYLTTYFPEISLSAITYETVI
jgi:integrase/recombinase XerD